jgi:hypothetical protein
MKSRVILWETHVACMEENRNVYTIGVSIPEGKRLIMESGHR